MVLNNKLVSSISNLIRKDYYQRRKYLLLLALSVMAISVDIKSSNCDYRKLILCKTSEPGKRARNLKEEELANLEIKFEPIGKREMFRVLKDRERVFMIQYAANNPIEDRCFVHTISLEEEADDHRDREEEEEEGSTSRSSSIEHLFVKNFQSELDHSNSECSTADSSNESPSAGRNIINHIFEEQSTCKEGPNNNFFFAGVIDGHGGWVVADIVKKSLSKYVRRELNRFRKLSIGDSGRADDSLNEQEVVKGLTNAYLSLDDDIKVQVEKQVQSGQTRFINIGACCLTVLIDNNNYYVSNVGDSMGILGRRNGFLSLNNLHSANNVEERRKLIDRHPNENDIVVCKVMKNSATNDRVRLMNPPDPVSKLKEDKYDHCYVKGRLQPTRNFGDFYLKYQSLAFDFNRKKYLVKQPFSFPYVTAKPEIMKIRKTPDDEFIVLVSDGVSDFLSSEEIYRIIKSNISHSVERASTMLVKSVLQRAAEEAGMPVQKLIDIDSNLKRRLHDDTTVVLIKLK